MCSALNVRPRKRPWLKELLERRPVDGGHRSRSPRVFQDQMGDEWLDGATGRRGPHSGPGFFYRKDLRGHFGCVNAIEFSNNGGHWISSGGDDRRVLLWNIEKALDGKGLPAVMKGQHNSNIFCLAFDNNNNKIFSGGNDEQVIVHDLQSGATVNVFLHQDALYGLSVDPLNDNVFASACDDGRVLIFDIRQPPSEDPFELAKFDGDPMHAVVYNPVDSRLLATANARQGITLWDIRKPKSALKSYGVKHESCMSVRFNSSGDRLLALRRRLPPVLYEIHSENLAMQFHSASYYNSCTMKSCSFAGSKDQFVLSGSDDFRLYMWRIPDEIPEDRWIEDAECILSGHRSIVNQVRYNVDNCTMLSSGVEKIIKVWSPYRISFDNGSNDIDDTLRPTYTHEDYVDLLVRNGPVMTHDYSNESLDEDPRMIAFFDSLVQREREAVSSDDDESVNNSNSEVVINDDLSDTDSSSTLSDFETLSLPVSLVPYPLTPPRFDDEIRSTTVPNVSCSVGESSSDDDDDDSLSSIINCSSQSEVSKNGSQNGCSDPAERSDVSHSSPSDFKSALAKIEGSDGVANALSRLKRLREFVLDEDDAESEKERRRRCLSRQKSPSTVNDSNGENLICTKKEVDKIDDSSIIALSFSSCNENNISSKDKRHDSLDDLSNSKPCNGTTSNSDLSNATNYQAGDNSNCLSTDNELVTHKEPGSSAENGQTVEPNSSNGGGLAPGEIFRQVKNRERISSRRYRASGFKCNDSESDSEEL